MQMLSITYLYLLTTLLYLCTVSNAAKTDATDACRQATASTFSASTWDKIVNATYHPLNAITPSTTHSWGASNITGLDRVNFNIVNSYTNNYETVYSSRPITQNRNAANIEKKVILIRWGFMPKDAKASREYRYYIIPSLFGCNVHLQRSFPIDWESFQWDYNVLSI